MADSNRPPSPSGPTERAEPPAGSRAIRRFAAIGVLIALAALVVSLAFGGGDQEHSYDLMFENAGQLVPDNQVQIGGHVVGSVDDISLTDDAVARIEVTVDQELHEGTTAVVRATSLAGVANHYVSISPGPNSEPALDDGATIGLTETTSEVSLDQVFNAFDRRTREGLSNFIKGQAGVYDSKGDAANQSYKYLEPALYQTDLFVDQLNADQRLFRRFITSSARVFTAVSARRDDLSSSVSNANTAFEAIARENVALDRSLELLPGTFRQSNTTFVNLRLALDDLDSLVDTAKPATEGLAAFLRKARPVATDAIPFFRDLRAIVDKPGSANDLAELTGILPEIQSRADTGFTRAQRAIADFQPTLDFARAYAPDMLNSLAKLGEITGYYDADGHYARTALADLNIFDYEQATQTLEPAPAADQFAPFGSTRIHKRCPGGAVQPAPDDSNPFFDPPWPGSGLRGSECDPSEVPPGP